jgi:hypothetical protein
MFYRSGTSRATDLRIYYIITYYVICVSKHIISCEKRTKAYHRSRCLRVRWYIMCSYYNLDNVTRGVYEIRSSRRYSTLSTSSLVVEWLYANRFIAVQAQISFVHILLYTARAPKRVVVPAAATHTLYTNGPSPEPDVKISRVGFSAQHNSVASV